jgi:two-component system, NtrC family, sensor kinase
MSTLKILIVDDTPTDQRLLKNILETQGYETTVVSGGLEAIAYVSSAFSATGSYSTGNEELNPSRLPDLILLDIQMSDLDGFSVCEYLQQDPHLAQIPIIFISAADGIADKVKAFQVGGLDYVTKPFHPDELLARVRTHLSLRSLQHQLQRQNAQLSDTLDQLRLTQTHLVISEKMAVLGQLVASMAHEMNTPLGVIRSSASATDEFLNHDFLALPELLSQLSIPKQFSLMEMIQVALNGTPWVLQSSSRDRRTARRQLIQQLDAHQISPSMDIADLLIDSGIHEDLSPYLSLLQAPNAVEVCRIIYGFTGLYRANQMTFSAVDRASTVVQALRRYAYVGDPSETVETDLVESLETVLTLYRSQMRHGVEVIRDFQTVSKIGGFPDALHQIWSNLINNALHAMEFQGTLKISLQQKDTHHVEISFTDSGKGIPENIQHQIFEPFFTTKAKGEGNGLGLSIIRTIVEQHQGTIVVTSRPQETRFTVTLPLTITRPSNEAA